MAQLPERSRTSRIGTSSQKFMALQICCSHTLTYIIEGKFAGEKKFMLHMKCQSGWTILLHSWLGLMLKLVYVIKEQGIGGVIRKGMTQMVYKLFLCWDYIANTSSSLNLGLYDFTGKGF
jgi:hypothetical protein